VLENLQQWQLDAAQTEAETEDDQVKIEEVTISNSNREEDSQNVKK
jgi:hypothetical protein